MSKGFKSGLVATALLLPALSVPAHAKQTCILGILCIGNSTSLNTTVDAPEISPALLTSGLAILGGVGLMIRKRRNKSS